MLNKLKEMPFNKRNASILIAFLSIVILCGAYLFYSYDENVIRNEKHNEIRAIAELKTNIISQWLKERNGDSKVLSRSPFFIENFLLWLNNKKNISIRNNIIERLMLFKNYLGYSELFICSTNKEELLSTNSTKMLIDTFLKRKIGESLEKKEVVFTDLYKSNDSIFYDIIAPMFSSDNIPVGAIVFRINPNDYLYPLIQSWPTPSKTAETLIIRKAGDSVVFLNELRHKKNTALKFSISLTKKEIIAVKAITENEGVYEGNDYRDIPVLADTRLIPGTSWYMITKIEQKEIYSELYFRFIVTALFSLILILTFIFIILWVYHYKQKNIYHILYQKEKELLASQEVFKTTLYSIGDAVITTDINSKITQMNPIAEKLTGWKESDAKGKALEEIFKIINEDTRNIVDSPVEKVLKEGLVVGLANHTLLISKDGNEIPISDSGAPIINSQKEIIGVVLVFRDQTEERKNKNILIEKEERIRLLLDSTAEAIYGIDLNGNCTFCNKATLSILGYSTEEELLGKNVHRLFHHSYSDGSEYPEKECLILKGLHNKQRTHIDDEVYWRKDGTCFPTEYWSYPIIKNNETVGIVVTFFDITDRKRNEEALRKKNRELEAQYEEYMQLNEILRQTNYDLELSKAIAEENEEKHRFLFENTNQGIICQSLDRTIIYMNQAAADILGVPSEQIIGTSIDKINWDAIYEDGSQFPKEFHPDNITFKTGKPVNNQIMGIFNKQNNLYIWININSYPKFKDKNILNQVIVTFENITENKNAKEALTKSYELLNNLTDQVPGVVYQYRLYPDGRSAFPYSSRGMYDIYEVTSEEVQFDASPVFTRLHPDDYDYVSSAIFESAKNQSLFHVEFRVILPKQGLRWRSSNAKPTLLEDGSILWYGIIIDVTKLKQTEEALQQQNKILENQYEEYMQLNEILRQTNYDLELAKIKAEESARLKTAFLQNMSHEIRTPLNGILGFSNLLKTENITNEEINEYTEIIKISGNRLLEIVNNVLDISKIETNQMEVNNKFFDLNALMTDLYNFFYPSINNNNIKFEYFNYLDGDNSIVNSDDLKVNQILTNLISNAIKFTKKGSIIFGYDIVDNVIRFYVKDSGIGIPEEFKKRIFERFTQVDLSITRGYEGAGLGLAICKGLVEKLDGSIWFESNADGGTIFIFTIPYKADSNINITIDEKFDIKVNNNIFKLLIVEDDFVSFQFLSKVLKSNHYILLHAENGKEAVDIVKNNKDLNLVLMDIRMPVMDGFEATKQIKTIRPDLPIIAQTAYAFSEEVNNILSLGCDDYISKPIEIDKLKELIYKYLDV